MSGREGRLQVSDMIDLRAEFRRVFETEHTVESGVAELLDAVHRWHVGRVQEYRAQGHAHAYILGILQGELEGMVILSSRGDQRKAED